MGYVQYAFNYPDSVIDFADGFDSLAGNRSNPHRGVDIAPNGGGAVCAVADGTLVYDWYSPILGNVAVIAHLDGKFSGYAHMASESPLRIGTVVARGQSIGTIGNTGSASAGRHLHLTIASSMGGAAGGYDVIDPVAWIRAHSAATAGTPGGAGMHTSTEQDGVPGAIYWAKVQSECKVRGWYDGSVDGVPREKTHHAHARLQAAILNERRGSLPRTDAEENGVAGKAFWTIAQTVGRGYGYSWAIDGIPGGNSEKALFKITAEWLNRHGR